MITKTDKIIFGIFGLFILITVVFWQDVKSMFVGETGQAQINNNNDKEKKKDKKNKKQSPEVTIAQKWEMPSQLKEISGIAYINKNLFACVQDEAGKIFIFNTATNSIEKEIPFSESGDYEGIAVIGSTAYVLRADGKLFEVSNYDTKPNVIMHSTHLTEKQDIEGLCYDKKNNRLLLSIKENEPGTKDYKGIYAFDLASKKLAAEPVHKIDLNHTIWNEVDDKDKIKPADIVVHPTTGDIYILDGPDPKILVMSPDGTTKNLYHLSESEFVQPEGISFTEAGEMYISNEGKDGIGNILKVSIQSNGKPRT